MYYRKHTLSLNTTPSLGYTFDYDDNKGSRLTDVTDGTYQATYAYLANSAMTAQTTFYESSSLRLQTTREYDLLNRLQRVYSRTNASADTPLISYFDYQYNQANQRTRSGLVNGSYWLYRYDALGQVTSGKKYWADGTPVRGQQYEYGFDDIGNRKYARSGGDSNGLNLRTASNNLNSANLNEYGNRTTPSSVDIIGLGEVGSSVTVNGSGADYRRGEYFREDLGLSTGVDPLWQSVSVTAGATTIAGHLLIPAATQSFSCDLDGNLTSDGVWTYYYDAENRLYRVENSTSLSPTSARKKLLFEYDHL